MKIMWTSKGKWDNGRKRTITGHEEKDPDDNTLMVAAGNNRKFEILGDGKALLSGARARIYILENNYDSVMELKFIPDSSLDDLSLKLRSRHQEGGDGENRFGGYGSAISLGEVECKREEFHNEHTTIGSKKLKDEKKLKNGKEYGVRYTCKDVNGKVNMKTEIDYGNGFIEVANFTDDDPEDYMTDKQLYDKKSYAWIRTNGDDPEEIQLRNVSIKPLTGGDDVSQSKQ
jgi:hypothetical protein